jgi:hypothetical protein
MAVDKYLREVFGLENLSDCQALATATNGQIPAWNDTTHRWEPVDQATSPIIYLGTGAWNSSKVNDAADSYGMAAGTVPSPADYPPAPGDQYLDLATGVVTAFTGPASPPSGRTVSTITGGSSPIDLVPNGLGDLIDVEIASTPADGQVLQYVAASSRWEPADPASASPIIYLGTGAWNAANVTSAADNYGMAADTVPSPTDYPPLPGDQYIDLATGVVTAFTGAPGAAPPTKRTAAAITAGASPVDAVPSDIGELRDVTLSSASDKQILQYESATNQWKNVTPDFLNPTNGYTKTEVDTKLTVLATGLEHYESVLSRTNTPPASPATNDLYIVGATPTGLWAGQTNNLARWDGAAWQFEAPKANESHLIESVAETWHWNGTAWVKVATATTTGGPAAAGELWMVGDIKESVLTEPQFKSLLSPAEQLKWALADGRDVTGSAYATTTGRNTIPDLRGAYLRMAGLNNAHTGWNGGTLNGHQEDSTARPRNVFATDHTGGHQHIHNKVEYAEPNVTWDPNAYVNYGTKGWVGQNITTSFEQSALKTKAAGAHTHTITSGGDPETRPKSYSINYFIKIN